MSIQSLTRLVGMGSKEHVLSGIVSTKAITSSTLIGTKDENFSGETMIS